MTDGYHTPVLRDDVCHYLLARPDGTYVDGTLGGGGHAEAIVQAFSLHGQLIAFDRDAAAISFAKQRLVKFHEQVIFVQENFSRMKSELSRLGFKDVDGVLLDLGVSSFQIDEGSRGFSFQQDSRLDMRMDQNQKLDAWVVINTYEQRKLADIFWKYGEERNSSTIARAIVGARTEGPVGTTLELSTIVERAIGGRFLQKSLARIFQAIRVEVNGELASLEAALPGALDVLRPGGRLVVIAYHSLEDRIVKNFLRKESRTSIPSGSRYIPDREVEPRLRLLTKKPIIAGQSEIARNSRARSAKLRAAERV